MKGLAIGAALVAVAFPAAGAFATADSVTLGARPISVTADNATTLFGAVGSGHAGELVEIEVKPCGQPSYTGVDAATTNAGGHRNAEYWPGINATLRARWRADVSATLSLGQRAWVRLTARRKRATFRVSVTGRAPVWRKRVDIQRRVSGGWHTVKRVVLTEQIGASGYGIVFTLSEFRLRVPRGSLLRAVLPRSQAKPCYLAGVSDTLRT